MKKVDEENGVIAFQVLNRTMKVKVISLNEKGKKSKSHFLFFVM